MYSRCLFCNADLARNEVVEPFPVGRRLAFDAARGRLWVVCRACERWNLSPLEERFEAVEACEALYRDARLRAATDNVGIARLREGLELVRIGRPLRPEFAAWRYGDQFGRRRRRRILVVGGGLTLLGAVAAGGLAAGAGIGGFGWILSQLATRIVRGDPKEVIVRLPTGRGLVEVQRRWLTRTSFAPGDDGSLSVALPLGREWLRLTGTEAQRAATMLLPHVNRFGGTREQVGAAVQRIEHYGDAASFLEAAVRGAERRTTPPADRRKSAWSGMGSRPATGLFALDRPTALAIEMALHEEQERRALEGELAELERAWREAEEVAAIADDMFVPAGVGAALDRLRARVRGE